MNLYYSTSLQIIQDTGYMRKCVQTKDSTIGISLQSRSKDLLNLNAEHVYNS